MRGTPGTPRTVSSADEARQLGHFINDPQRRHPIVVVSADRSGHSSFDADEAAAALRIHADVWVISEIHTWRLNDHLGSETVFGDAAAVFPPHGEGRLTRQLLTHANGHSTDALVQAALAAVPSRAKRARRVERATPAARVLGSPGLHTPTTASEIDLLAEHLLDPGRDRPVVVVTIPSRRSEPWIDAQAIVDTMGPEAEVHLIATGPRTFQLTSRLNRMAGVYGGAGRVYDVGQEWLDDPWRFPLRFAYDEAEGGRATDALVNDLMAALLRSGHVSTAPQETSRPVSGKVAGIVVPSRALIRLDDGSMATVWSELTVPGVDVERLLVEGMRVSGMLDPEHRRVDITGMPRDPQQVVTTLTPGCAVLARVDEVRSDAVTLTPFPGVSSRLLADEVTGNDLDDLTELMGVGEVVTAHYLGAESAGTWRLRLADVDDDEVAVPLPLIEGGPAWLATAAGSLFFGALLLDSRLGPASNDPHGYALVFGTLFLVPTSFAGALALPFVVPGRQRRARKVARTRTMGLNIKNERVHELARQAAAATGKTQTGAIEEALTHLLADYDIDPDERRRAVGHADRAPSMIVDSSALIAIIEDEPGADALVRAALTSRCRTSVASRLEVSIVADARSASHGARLDELVSELEITIEPVTEQQGDIARRAHQRIGRGSGSPRPAQLRRLLCLRPDPDHGRPAALRRRCLRPQRHHSRHHESELSPAMSSYAGACEVCTAVCIHAARHPSVRQVAEADWVQIRHCSRCGAWWDMQPANRPAVITRDEAARRVPDPDGWTVVGPLLEPRDRDALLVDAQRVDAHLGDQVDLHRQVELAGDATLRDVVVTVVEPFVWSAPRTTWLVRSRSEGGAWLPLAEVVTVGPPETHGTRMLLADSPAREFAGGARLEISCLTPR